jgi:hypothetical protein
MNKTTLGRVKAACAKDPSIITRPEDIDSAPGYSEAYFEFLGVEVADLKSLEAQGFASRGYKDFTSGRQVRWTLLAKE